MKALHAETNLGFEPDEEIFDNQDGSRVKAIFLILYIPSIEVLYKY